MRFFNVDNWNSVYCLLCLLNMNKNQQNVNSRQNSPQVKKAVNFHSRLERNQSEEPRSVAFTPETRRANFGAKMWASTTHDQRNTSFRYFSPFSSNFCSIFDKDWVKLQILLDRIWRWLKKWVLVIFQKDCWKNAACLFPDFSKCLLIFWFKLWLLLQFWQ